MEENVTVPEIVGNKGRDAQAEVDVAVFGQQRRRALGHLRAGPGGLAVVGAWDVGRTAIATEAAPIWLDGAFHHARDETPCQAHAVRVDFAYPELMLVIEVDGFRYHSSPEATAADQVRQAALEALGWTVLRFWEHEDPVSAAGSVEAAVRDTTDAGPAPPPTPSQRG